MTETPRSRGPRRLDKADGPTGWRSFLRSGIGMRIVLLSILLFTACMMLWSRGRQAERREREAAAAAAEAAASAPRIPTEEELAARRRSNALAFEGALNDTVNGDDFIETPGYRKLVELVAGSAPHEVSERASTYLDHASAMAAPDMYRGEYVRIRGLLGGLSAYKLDVPALGVTDVWRGTISQPDGETDTVVFDLVSDPPPVELRRSVVEVEGVLYRTVAYESRTGDARVAPYLIARNVQVLPGKHTGGGMPRVMITAAGVGTILVYFLLRHAARKRNPRGPQKPPGFKQLFETSRSAERTRQITGPKGS